MGKILTAVVALLIALLGSGAAQAEEGVCPEGMHAIYSADGTLISCEEIVGSPESCPGDAEPGYLSTGQLAGCFTFGFTTEEVCSPTGVDGDGDGLDDDCDPCPEDADCDNDGFCDGSELYVGTDLLDACPDDAEHAAWPPDINNDTQVNVFDLME